MVEEEKVKAEAKEAAKDFMSRLSSLFEEAGIGFEEEKKIINNSRVSLNFLCDSVILWEAGVSSKTIVKDLIKMSEEDKK